MAEETKKRKADHIKICLEQKSQASNATSGFEDVQFVHRALPEINREEIDLKTSFLNYEFSAPLFVGAMTGGTEQAKLINAAVAEAVEKLNLGMGVGSQRAAIEDREVEKTFSIARERAPHAFIVANIGGVQLANGYGLEEVEKIVDMIDADAVAVHLNALQEVIQHEGQTDFRGILAKIEEISGYLHKPVIVKETGCGISAEDAAKLEASGVKSLDIGGAGGTSFAAVESHRAKRDNNLKQRNLGEAFRDWGIRTAISLVEVTQTIKIPVIASGGIRSGIDAAKAIALNASLASITQPVLKAAIKGPQEVEKLLSLMIEELRNTMFLVGAEKTPSLPKTPIVIMGKTAEWLRTRGFNVDECARRGAR